MRSTAPLLGEMIATTLPSKLSRSPPDVATRSVSYGLTSTPSSFSTFVDTKANASVREMMPGFSRRTWKSWRGSES